MAKTAMPDYARKQNSVNPSPLTFAAVDYAVNRFDIQVHKVSKDEDVATVARHFAAAVLQNMIAQPVYSAFSDSPARAKVTAEAMKEWGAANKAAIAKEAEAANALAALRNAQKLIDEKMASVPGLTPDMLEAIKTALLA